MTSETLVLFSPAPLSYDGFYAHCPDLAAVPPGTTFSFQAGIKEQAEGVKCQEIPPASPCMFDWERFSPVTLPSNVHLGLIG